MILNAFSRCLLSSLRIPGATKKRFLINKTIMAIIAALKPSCELPDQ